MLAEVTKNNDKIKNEEVVERVYNERYLCRGIVDGRTELIEHNTARQGTAEIIDGGKS